MKKLMTLATVALCTAAMADGIVSSSIVGYQNKKLDGNGNYNLCVATFKPASKDADKMVLGDIGVSVDFVSGNDQVKTLKANGAVDTAYTYVTKEMFQSWNVNGESGWYLTADALNDDIDDYTDLIKNNEPLPMGNGLVVFVGSAATTLTYSGEVMKEDQPIALKGNGNYNITGNISPVEITLGDITPSADWVSGNDQLKTVKKNGAVDQAYTYATKAMFDGWGVPGYTGWYLTADILNDNIDDYSELCKNSEPVAAGEAFYVLVSSATTTITIPSAL